MFGSNSMHIDGKSSIYPPCLEKTRFTTGSLFSKQRVVTEGGDAIMLKKSLSPNRNFWKI